MDDKHCRDCGNKLLLGDNWLLSQKQTRNYICKSCRKILSNLYHAKHKLTKDDWNKIPNTNIRCQGAVGYTDHIISKELMANIYTSPTYQYSGICKWCWILSTSQARAKKGEYTSLQLPPNTTPWEFFPKAIQEQNYTCFIPWCTTKENGKRLAADHDHYTGQFRGFICGHHNNNFMNGIDEAREHGIIINLPFTYPGNKYYKNLKIPPKNYGDFLKEGTGISSSEGYSSPVVMTA